MGIFNFIGEKTKKYTETHEWVDSNEGQGRVGISTYARQELGEIVYIELPSVGQKIKAGEQVAVLESTKAATDVYSPVSGEVIAVNERVKQDPSLINQSPQDAGYLFEIALTHPQECELLTSENEYHQWVQDNEEL